MPIFCFKTEDGEVIKRNFLAGKVSDEIVIASEKLTDNTLWAKRYYQVEADEISSLMDEAGF